VVRPLDAAQHLGQQEEVDLGQRVTRLLAVRRAAAIDRQLGDRQLLKERGLKSLDDGSLLPLLPVSVK
jgi:hypothetical protein